MVLAGNGVEMFLKIVKPTEEALAAGVYAVRGFHEVLLEIGQRVGLVWWIAGRVNSSSRRNELRERTDGCSNGTGDAEQSLA